MGPVYHYSRNTETNVSRFTFLGNLLVSSDAERVEEMIRTILMIIGAIVVIGWILSLL
ncbi:hypothetical protein [Virgibacillus doumboii]|uniref:hypothetical protein n=1 Tax=Virgibacillus doumboii TaxID=2697503 RepID=UPI001966E633|nr:hypothetical protein [Virgibacillus doumboii]